MKNVNLKPFVYIFLGISAISFIVIALYSNVDLEKFWDLVLILPKVATVDLFVWFIFREWAWKWKAFQGWLVPFPDLNGTWQGSIQTTWVNPETGQRPGPIPTILTIKQSFSNISCVMRTSEMTSYSYSEGFELSREHQIRRLTYSYTSRPNPTVTERSATHEGTITFEIIGTPVTRLKGNYWTARRTTGEVTLTLRCKERLDQIPQDLGNHPVSH